MRPVKVTEEITRMHGADKDSTPPKAVVATKGLLSVKYPSVTAAAKATGINRGSTHGCLTGKRKTAGGYSWSYCESDESGRG